jgi:hypothetical protein
MLVRPVRSRQRAHVIRAAALAAFVIAARPNLAHAQEPASTMPASHTVKRGDTLWDIAKLYLGDPFLWPEIYRINTDIIEDPHWIYPGEVLKLPGAPARVVAVTPPPAPTPQPVVSQPVAQPIAPQPQPAPPPSTVRVGEFVASPWVDQRGGPRGSGYIMQARDLPGIASADLSRMQLFDRVIISPPVGAVAPERELYLSYVLGPLIEDLGQIVIPTGVIEVTRAPRNGEAAVGRVIKMFADVRQEQRLIPLDTTAAIVRGGPSPIGNGREGVVRWIHNQPVLPSLQNYVVIDISRRDGLATGDHIDFFQPKHRVEGRELAIPEVWIGRAQVLRVTPFGATARIISQEQPKIQEGTAVRVAAKMP